VPGGWCHPMTPPVKCSSLAMSVDGRPPDPKSLSHRQVLVMAVACAFAIATLYYNQPLLPLIRATYGITDTFASTIVMVGQLGYALGLLLFVPHRRPDRPPSPHSGAASCKHAEPRRLRHRTELQDVRVCDIRSGTDDRDAADHHSDGRGACVGGPARSRRRNIVERDVGGRCRSHNRGRRFRLRVACGECDLDARGRHCADRCRLSRRPGCQPDAHLPSPAWSP
jgi:hypothetical protein